jgi:very-short-patch-repair endonuclease
MSLAHAKTLRKQMTDAEHRLWYLLRAHRFAGVKFKRQIPIGHYIADFVCFDRKIIIEVDGGQHAGSAHDRRRDEWLSNQGFRVLRFWNNDVLKNTDGVLTMIAEALETSPSPGALRAPPSPTGGEGKGSARRRQ